MNLLENNSKMKCLEERYRELLPKLDVSTTREDCSMVCLRVLISFIMTFLVCFFIETFQGEVFLAMCFYILLMLMVVVLIVCGEIDRRIHRNLYINGETRRYVAMDKLREEMGFSDSCEGRMTFVEAILSLQNDMLFFKINRFFALLSKCLVVMLISGMMFLTGKKENDLSLMSGLLTAFMLPVINFLIPYFPAQTDTDFVTTAKEYKKVTLRKQMDGK